MTKICSDLSESWRLCLSRQLPLWGHRNWIVIADSAYPAHSNVGIETISTESDYFEVARDTFKAIRNCRHLRAKIYLDAELELVSVRDAPEVERYKRKLEKLMEGRDLQVMAHEQIIQKLDECAKHFRILILKSTLTIPYTSIFIELECGYWSPEAEVSLRRSLTSRDALESSPCD